MMRWLLMLAVVAVAGCADSPSTMRQRQDEALRDPFNYSPYKDPNDISGGGIGTFNKDAFKRDVNSVLSP